MKTYAALVGFFIVTALILFLSDDEEEGPYADENKAIWTLDGRNR